MGIYLVLKTTDREIKFGKHELELLFNTIINPEADNYQEVINAANKLSQDLKDNLTSLFIGPVDGFKLSLSVDDKTDKNIKKTLKHVVFEVNTDVKNLLNKRYDNNRTYKKQIAKILDDSDAKDIVRFLILFDLIKDAAIVGQNYVESEEREGLIAGILELFSTLYKKYKYVTSTISEEELNSIYKLTKLDLNQDISLEEEFKKSSASAHDLDVSNIKPINSEWDFSPGIDFLSALEPAKKVSKFVAHFKDGSKIGFDIKQLHALVQKYVNDVEINATIDARFKVLTSYLSGNLIIDQTFFDDFTHALKTKNVLSKSFAFNINEDEKITDLQKALSINFNAKEIIQAWFEKDYNIENIGNNIDDNSVWLYKILLDKNEDLLVLLKETMRPEDLYVFLASYLPLFLVKSMHDGDDITFAILQRTFSRLEPHIKDAFNLKYVEVVDEEESLDITQNDNREILIEQISNFFQDLSKPFHINPSDVNDNNAALKKIQRSGIEIIDLDSSYQEIQTSEFLENTDFNDNNEEEKSPDCAPPKTFEQKIGFYSNVAGWRWQTKNNNHSFFEAIVAQMQIIEHTFLENYDNPNIATNFLLREYAVFNLGNLLIQGTIFKILQDFPNLIIAIANKKSLEKGFTAYYKLDDNKTTAIAVAESDIDDILKIKQKRVIRLVQDNNIFSSVTSHPALINGALRAAFNANNDIFNDLNNTKVYTPDSLIEYQMQEAQTQNENEQELSDKLLKEELEIINKQSTNVFDDLDNVVVPMPALLIEYEMQKKNQNQNNQEITERPSNNIFEVDNKESINLNNDILNSIDSSMKRKPTFLIDFERKKSRVQSENEQGISEDLFNKVLEFAKNESIQSALHKILMRPKR